MRLYEYERLTLSRLSPKLSSHKQFGSENITFFSKNANANLNPQSLLISKVHTMS